MLRLSKFGLGAKLIADLLVFSIINVIISLRVVGTACDMTREVEL